MPKPNGIGNNPFFRGISDRLDDRMGWHGARKERSGARGLIHAVYHGIVGIKDAACFNFGKSGKELRRAGEQLGRSTNIGRSPPRK